jgi:ribosomal protein L11 methyltransferase
MAFGTGTHPTTQLCLELLEKDFVIHHPSSVIDVGCGSGILSIAALKLGAQSVLGVDIDAGSIVNARENANTNQIGDELMLGVGSVADILEGKFPLRKAPLVLANILAPVIVRLLDAGLAELLAEDGTLILSGILHDQARSVVEAAQTKHLSLVEQKQRGDWVALTMSWQF